MTVAGPTLGRADAYATAAFAMGVAGLRWCTSLPGYAACAVTVDQRLLLTRGMERGLSTRARVGGGLIRLDATTMLAGRARAAGRTRGGSKGRAT